MLKNIKSILFATNLSIQCQSALESSIYIANQHAAKLTLLHVVDRDFSGEIQEYFNATLGSQKWKHLKEELEEEVHQSLIGKMTFQKISQKVMQDYCAGAGVGEAYRKLNWQEVVMSNNDIANAIISQSIKNSCDLIVLGSKKGIMKKNSLGTITKKVIKDSEVPVMVVPAYS